MITSKKATSVALLFLLATFVVFGLVPASAQAPTVTKTATTASANTQLTATATFTPTATLTKAVVPSLTATKAAATQTVTPSATVSRTQVAPTATVTRTLTPSATATKLTLTPTKAATATPTKTYTLIPTPTTLPRVAPKAGTVTSLSTAFVVQNTDPSTTANVTATFYDPSGTAVSTVNRTIEAYRSTVIDQRAADGGLGSFSSWQGSVVLSSNTQLAAVVNQYGGNAQTSGRSFRADSYNGISSSGASRTALLPQVLKNITDVAQQKTYNSMIVIQNTNASASANVTITYTNIYTGTPVNSVRTGIVIPPSASVFIDMQSEVPQWAQFFGPARISADQNIAVVVNQNADGSLLVYRGFTEADGSTSIVVTQGLTNIFDTGQQLNYGSAVEGMVVDGSSVAVTVQFTNLLGGTSTCTFPPGSTFRVDLRYQYRSLQVCPPPLAAGNRFFGSMTFTASKPIVALSNLQSDYSPTRGIRASTSRAFVATGTPGAMTAFAPLLMNNYYDTGTAAWWGTALEARFLSGTGTATITYYDLDSSSTWVDTYTAGTDQIFRWDQRLVNPQTGFSLPAGKRVSAVITAPNPFVFTVNIQATSATSGDALTVYMSR